MVEEARSLATAHQSYAAYQALDRDVESFFDNVSGFNADGTLGGSQGDDPLSRFYAPAAGDEYEDSKDYPAAEARNSGDDDKKSDQEKVEVRFFGVNSAEANSGAIAAGGEALFGPESVVLLSKQALKVLKQAGTIVEAPVGAMGAALYFNFKVSELNANNAQRWATIAALNESLDVKPHSTDISVVITAVDPFEVYDMSNKDDANYILYLAKGHALEQQGYNVATSVHQPKSIEDYIIITPRPEPQELGPIGGGFQIWEDYNSEPVGCGGIEIPESKGPEAIGGGFPIPEERGPLVFTKDIPGIDKINGRNPINADKFAGQDYPLPSELVDKYPEGVKFDDKGFARFEPYTYVDSEGTVYKVKLDNLTGEQSIDSNMANKSIGKNLPLTHTWHHVEDGKTMIGVPKELHKKVKHTGGRARIKENTK